MDFYYLSELILPYSLKAIGNNAFCSSIERITCKSPLFKVDNNALLSADRKVFYRYFGKDRVYLIPNGVNIIIGGAFPNMEMHTIIIPESVEEIGDNPFAGVFERDKELNYSYHFYNKVFVS